MYYGYMFDSLELSICIDLDKFCVFYLKNRYKFYIVIYISIQFFSLKLDIVVQVYVGDIIYGLFGNLYGVKI